MQITKVIHDDKGQRCPRTERVDHRDVADRLTRVGVDEELSRDETDVDHTSAEIGRIFGDIGSHGILRAAPIEPHDRVLGDRVIDCRHDQLGII